MLSAVPSRSAGIAFGRIASTVAVRDLPRALAFYVGVLGMEVTFENGDPVGFVILKRDAAELPTPTATASMSASS
jgi:catechol 2,3-dioxygenase-like lactoylglutathione lyase family enzyme